MAEAEAPEKEGGTKKKSKMPKTLVLVLVIAVIEGAAFYGISLMTGGGPQPTYGAEGADGHLLEGEQAKDVPTSAEIEVLDRLRVPNDRSGRLYIYDFDVAMKVPGARVEDAQKLVTERNREISDRIARIIRAADPPALREPELKTVRTQLQQAIGEVIGDPELILEVLIPRCVPVRSD